MAKAKLDEVATWNTALHFTHRKALFHFFLRKVRSQAEAEDLAQDALVRLINRPPETNARHPEAYVFTVAINLLRDRARKLRVRGPGQSTHELNDELYRFDVASEAPGPERVLIGKRELDRVAGALSELTERTRSIFILCRVEGMSHREIAAQLGVSISAVEKHVSKALQHIADRLNP